MSSSRTSSTFVLQAKPAGIMLMGSNGRHAHEWAVFQDVTLPEDKYLIPGVLDSTTNVVEHPEVIAQRAGGVPRHGPGSRAGRTTPLAMQWARPPR
jgi:methionine synthase II (cobalamin-independent)